MFNFSNKPPRKPSTIRFGEDAPSTRPPMTKAGSFNALTSNITAALSDMSLRSPNADPGSPKGGSFDNGVDPDQRLSLDSNFKAKASPDEEPPPEQSWVDANFPKVAHSRQVDKDLEARIRAFFQRYDANKLDDVARVAAWTSVHGETFLNAKLVLWYKVGLPLPKKDRKNSLVDMAPATLREQVKAFLEANDRALLKERGDAIVDSMVRMASAQGLEALNAYLDKKYGKNLVSEPAEAPQTAAPASAAVSGGGRFVELSVDDALQEQEKMRADLITFYSKHDTSKLEDDKLRSIVQWAVRIGRAEIDAKFAEKYGESLSDLERARALHGLLDEGSFVRTGTYVPPAESPLPAKKSLPKGCGDFKEADPYLSFGVCTCGLSRADHAGAPTILVPGSGKPAALLGLNSKKSSTSSSSSPASSAMSSAPRAGAHASAAAAATAATAPKHVAAKPAPAMGPVAARSAAAPAATPAVTPASHGASALAQAAEQRAFLAKTTAPVSAHRAPALPATGLVRTRTRIHANRVARTARAATTHSI